MPNSLSSLLKATARTLVPREVRNWLRSPTKSARWILDAARFGFGRRELLCLTPEFKLVCHPGAFTVFKRDQVEDPEQSAEFRTYLSHCTDAMRLFDIGAHFGIFSLAAARFGGRAVAVDPSKIATRMIKRQAELNSYGSQIQIVEAAVGEDARAVEMLSAGVFSDGYYKHVKPKTRKDIKMVRSITIDELAQQYGDPTHIKIDVEGHEAAVLRGARRTLTRCAPILFLELHNAMVAAEGSDPGQTLDELASIGYTLRSTDGQVAARSAALAQSIVRMVCYQDTSTRPEHSSSDKSL